MQLCEHSRRDQPCWGKIVTHKKYGKSGREKGQLIEVIPTCEGHARAEDGAAGAYDRPKDPECPGYWGKDDR